MESNLKQEAMKRVGEVEHHECYYDTDRNKPLPGRRAATSVDRNSVPQQFLDYVAANYNGVIDIHRPEWHAKRLWKAAISARAAMLANSSSGEAE